MYVFITSKKTSTNSHSNNKISQESAVKHCNPRPRNMQPEPPEFLVGEKATFKHIKREPEKTTFSRQVGSVTGVRWAEPFYEFTLQGDHVDAGRWYKQTELDQFKEGTELENRAAEADILSKTRSSLETARTESENLRVQNEALSLTLTDLALRLADARARISDLEESEAQAKTANVASDGWPLHVYQNLEAARDENDGLRQRIATLSTASEAHKAVQADLATALAQVAELEPLREQIATLSREAEAHGVVKAELEAARVRIAELEKEATGQEAIETKLNAIIAQLTVMNVASGAGDGGSAPQ
ncbi:hypothetical protein FKW77_005340 [Venturia effusa]|uniref:Uncharacterized protein n=1 Tax=Venturia effusa TaxID=50376 RepID=A0A517KWC4_9PEZI|nr:hypothetical protein FKW77_005340 [Venturia effusa]